MFSRTLVRYGGFAAAFGGALTITGRFLSSLHPTYTGPSIPNYKLEILALLPMRAFNLLSGALYFILITMGLAGLYILLTQAGYSNKVTIAGVVIACSSTMSLAGYALHGFWVLSRQGHLIETPFFGVVADIASYTSAIGILLIGFVAIRTPEALGKWRFLPLVLGLLASPMAFIFVQFFLKLAELLVDGVMDLASAILFGFMPMLVGLFWILLGRAMWSRVDNIGV